MLPRGSQRRVPRSAAYLALLLYAATVWFAARPGTLQNWRQTDTQTIAWHFTEPGASIFRPRIAWGGAGPGYVEAEFQLYTFIVSFGLRVFGNVAWVGQLFSLLATIGTACVAFEALMSLYGAGPALFGVLALLSSRSLVVLAASVQPDALCLFLYVSAWFAFLRYEADQRRRWLWFYAALGAAAMLVKPTAAHLGISTFLLAALRSPALLKRAELWAAWLVMVGLLVTHLLIARTVYLESGNTFGVLSGGESKVPQLRYLLQLTRPAHALLRWFLWGPGPVAGVALVAALVIGRDRSLLLALLAGNLVWTLLALRYTSQDAGNYYHVAGALLGAQASAICAQAAARNPRFAPVLALFAVGLAFAVYSTLRYGIYARVSAWDAPAVAAASAASQFVRSGDLIVVRSPELRWDAEWDGINNFEDPRVFYLTKTHGWILSLEDASLAKLEHSRDAGARIYVETVPAPESPSREAWLTGHATLVATTPFGGRVFTFSNDSRG